MTTFYLKYRPQTLDELDLTDVRNTLKKIVASDNLPHAFLFAGPKGTGKTSAARILAKILNCEKLRSGFTPCNKCSQCVSITKGENMDVVEMDAASHRGIDDVRGIKEALKLAPIAAKKKVYIIDEAHMLTTEASNALLKTLEEPPDHVVFILATTNPEKLIETIRSRSVLIPFVKAGVGEIASSLKKVLEGEKVEFQEEIFEIIAKVVDGSFRDATKLTEQILAEGVGLNTDEVSQYVLKNRVFKTEDFLQFFAKRDSKGAIEMLKSLVSRGVNTSLIVKSSLEVLRESLYSQVGVTDKDKLQLFDEKELILLIKLLSGVLRDISTSFIEELPLEIAVVEWCGFDKSASGDNSSGEDKKSKESSIKKETKSGDAKGEITNKQSDKDLMPKLIIDNQILKNGDFPDDLWRKLLTITRDKNTSTEALLRAAKPLDFDGNKLTLGVYYKFHKERLESHPHVGILEDIITDLIGKRIRLACVLTDPPVKEVLKEKIPSVGDNLNKAVGGVVLVEKVDSDVLKAAKEIFGN